VFWIGLTLANNCGSRRRCGWHESKALRSMEMQVGRYLHPEVWRTQAEVAPSRVQTAAVARRILYRLWRSAVTTSWDQQPEAGRQVAVGGGGSGGMTGGMAAEVVSIRAEAGGVIMHLGWLLGGGGGSYCSVAHCL